MSIRIVLPKGMVASPPPPKTCPHMYGLVFPVRRYLSLPMPSAKTRTLLVTALWADGSAKPVQYGFELPKAAAIG